MNLTEGKIGFDRTGKNERNHKKTSEVNTTHQLSQTSQPTLEKLQWILNGL